MRTYLEREVLTHGRIAAAEKPRGGSIRFIFFFASRGEIEHPHRKLFPSRWTLRPLLSPPRGGCAALLCGYLHIY